MSFLERYFRLSEHGTNVRREISSGIVTFVAMSYILAVQPSLMEPIGMPKDAVTASTALVAAIASIAMGIFGRYPFALAPGMGANIIFSYVLVQAAGLSWQQGMTVVLLSGVLFLALTLLNLREAIVKMLPTSLKLGIGSVVGIFLIYLGMVSSGLAVVSEKGFTLGDLQSPQVLLSLCGFFLVFALMIHRVKGAVLIGMIAVTLISIPFGFVKLPEHIVSLPPSVAPIFCSYDFSALFSWKVVPFILVLFISDFFDTLGTLLGVSAQAGYLDKEGNLPHIGRPFFIDACATVVGSLFGLTTVTAYVESVAGIANGGKTGLVSIATGVCFLIALFFTPLILMIPAVATAPILLIVGFLLLDNLQHVPFGKLDETVPPLSMLVFTIFTLNMTTGIAVGVLLYIFIKCMKGEFKDVPIGLYVLGGIFFYYLIQQMH